MKPKAQADATASVRRSSRIGSATGKESKKSDDKKYDAQICEICKKGGHDNKMLLCDNCDGGYHMFCLTPPLTRVPSGEWFCSECREEKEKDTKEDKPKSKSKSKAKPKGKEKEKGKERSKRQKDKESEDEKEDESESESESENEDNDNGKNKNKKNKSPVRRSSRATKGRRTSNEKDESEESQESEESDNEKEDEKESEDSNNEDDQEGDKEEKEEEEEEEVEEDEKGKKTKQNKGKQLRTRRGTPRKSSKEQEDKESEDKKKDEMQDESQPRRSGRKRVARDMDREDELTSPPKPTKRVMRKRNKDDESSEDDEEEDESGSQGSTSDNEKKGKSDVKDKSNKGKQGEGEEEEEEKKGEEEVEDKGEKEEKDEKEQKKEKKEKVKKVKKEKKEKKAKKERKEKEEEESEDEGKDVMCSKCGKGDDEAKLLLCDQGNCKRGSHPLEKIPTGKWFCDVHSGGGKSERKRRMRRRVEDHTWDSDKEDDEFDDENDDNDENDEDAEDNSDGGASDEDDDHEPEDAGDPEIIPKRKYRKRRQSADASIVSPETVKQFTPSPSLPPSKIQHQSTSMFSKLEVPKSDVSSIMSDFSRITKTHSSLSVSPSPSASPAPSPPATPVPEKPISVAWGSSVVASPQPSPSNGKPAINVAWELPSLTDKKAVAAPTPIPSASSPPSTPISTTNPPPAPLISPPKPNITNYAPNTGKTFPKPANTSTITNFWRGGLTVDGKFICNLAAFCKADIQKRFLRNEWPKILDAFTSNGYTSASVVASLDISDPIYLSLLPEKFEPAFKTLMSHLEKNQAVCVVPLATRDLVLISSPLPTLHARPLSGPTPSILVALVNKSEASKPLQPKPQPIMSPIGPGGVPSPVQGVGVKGISPTAPTKPLLFMSNVRLSVVGVMKTETHNLSVVKHTVGYLVQHGGADIFHEFPTPGKTNLIIVHTPYVANLTEVPCLLDLKLDPSVKFVRGLQYLENCCKAAQQLPISPTEKLFPSVIVVDVGAALQEDTFRRLFTSVDKEAKKQVEWKVKIERSLVATLKTMNDIRAFRACDVIAAYIGKKIFEVTPEEEPQSHGPTNDALPPFLVRTALKLAFTNANKYRHIILLTTDKDLATVARRHHILAVDMGGLDLFFKAQTV